MKQNIFKIFSVLNVLVFVSFLGACDAEEKEKNSGGEPADGCLVGAKTACVCPGGWAGLRECLSETEYGPCSCWDGIQDENSQSGRGTIPEDGSGIGLEPPECGNGTCEKRDGESCVTCPEDCICRGEKICVTELNSCCLPATCPEEIDCGEIEDGCGGTRSCGTCPENQVCGGGGVNLCGEEACEALTCSDAIVAANVQCGLVSDDCGTMLACECDTTTDVCVDNACCTPLNECPAGKQCGSIDDGCGGILSCGECPAEQFCDDNQQCGGIPCTPASACAANQCGAVSDGCGGLLNCPLCPTGMTCNANHICEAACVPDVCGFTDCGYLPDGCGGYLNCGGCAAGQICANNRCEQCFPSGNCPTGSQCGEVADGCGGTISCGTCNSGYTCNEDYQCTEEVCETNTCTSDQCGLIFDGCGGYLQCGTCSTGYECQNGYCQETGLSLSECSQTEPYSQDECYCVQQTCGFDDLQPVCEESIPCWNELRPYPFESCPVANYPEGVQGCNPDCEMILPRTLLYEACRQSGFSFNGVVGDACAASVIPWPNLFEECCDCYLD